MNEALWFAAGFLLFRIASRCNLVPTRFGPSRLFPKLTGKGKAKSLEALAEQMAREEPGRRRSTESSESSESSHFWWKSEENRLFCEVSRLFGGSRSCCRNWRSSPTSTPR